MEKKKKTKKGNNKNSAFQNIVYDMRAGKTVSINTIRTNAWIIITALVAVLSLIGLRYKTKTKMEQIKQLNIELQRSESSKLQEKASYMSLIRETEMKKMVEEKGLDLHFQEQPPFELTKD